MADIITLDDTRLVQATEILADCVAEIPLYRWLLGEHVDDQSKREWLSEILIRPLLHVGCVVGAVADDRLIGVLLWQAHDVDLAPGGEPPLTPADVQVAIDTPGLRERLLELWTSDVLVAPAEDAVNCMLVAVLPEFRRASVTLDMMREVQEFCIRSNRPFYAWTGSAPLRWWFQDGWSATEFGSVEWHGTAMYGVVSDRPPTLKPVPPERRAHAETAAR
ncbi:hypothetical protein [Gordonia zhaorongruii]|uniref:hypothetical protein n=1 Tax=Gordonia zhaorongruii TaxID=2597659 RepID=UPI0010515D30|nr:hypothetical protein [Gordonia zhaorongruii]